MKKWIKNMLGARRDKGFTLIELLVVIAIIGILAALVLVALNTARNKAKDARVKADLGQLRVVAENYYDSQATNTYAGWEALTPATTLIADIDSQNGTGTPTAGGTQTTYCASSPLNVAANGPICVNELGLTLVGQNCTASTGLCS